jgi:hypothetical protein
VLRQTFDLGLPKGRTPGLAATFAGLKPIKAHAKDLGRIRRGGEQPKALQKALYKGHSVLLIYAFLAWESLRLACDKITAELGRRGGTRETDCFRG